MQNVPNNRFQCDTFAFGSYAPEARRYMAGLQIANSVRIVLIEFAERLAQAMKDEAELNDAVSRLANKKAG